MHSWQSRVLLSVTFAPVPSLNLLWQYKDFVRICKFPALFPAEPNLKTMAVLKRNDYEFSSVLRLYDTFLSFSLSFSSLFLSLLERFHFISSKIREPLSLTISLFILYALQDYISVSLFFTSPFTLPLFCLRAFAQLYPFYILQLTLSPVGPHLPHCWATLQYCNVKHNTLLSKRCVVVKRKMRWT